MEENPTRRLNSGPKWTIKAKYKASPYRKTGKSADPRPCLRCNTDMLPARLVSEFQPSPNLMLEIDVPAPSFLERVVRAVSAESLPVETCFCPNCGYVEYFVMPLQMGRPNQPETESSTEYPDESDEEIQGWESRPFGE